MAPPTSQRDPATLRVRFVADAPSVPGARRFVADGLRHWRRQGLLDDASLVVSEMAANAALHSGSPFMHISLEQHDDAVRIAVEDDGRRVPVAALVPQRRPSPDAPDAVEAMSSTGRGLAIVSVLARHWGIDEQDGRRRIWAELAEGGAEYGVRPPELTTPLQQSPPRVMELPEGWKTVRMPQCPVRLGIRIDQHLDDLIRELQLVDGSDGSPSRELGGLIESLVSPRAYARHMGRRIGQEAAAAGLDHVDIEMTMPRSSAPDIAHLLELVEEADRLCRGQELLTLASTPEMVSLREWFTESMVNQLENDAEPVPYADWLPSR
jgi:anti-sigma regulatory factor (Ser/Thr protein kinase)